MTQPPPAYPRMRIGLMGGTFNPAHDGHRHIAVEALKRLRLHQVWWIVTPQNPLKSAGAASNFNARLASARAAARHPRIVVTAFEASLSSTYTLETLSFLRRRAPGARFVWIMGADNLAGFHRWRGWRALMRLMPIAVFDRPGWRRRALSSPAAVAFRSAQAAESRAAALPGSAPPRWVFVSQPPIAISSTALREQTLRRG
ncbi:MAG: nicotinate-nucleotide adenylyltransferase [Hyphomicrobiales bacterium]|nr:nicotinate-nucleotide adenylyltransferase [Hyphomicrobiales bacterium]